jgi:arylsulfatase
MKPLLLCLVAAACHIWLSSYSAAAAPRSDRLPNIVLIFTDDQGYADVGVFGGRGLKTPNLDRLASEGRVFRNFHVAQPVCSASRAALLTGCYPNRIGIHGALGPGSKTGINEREVTLAELVKQRGYATGIFGKWHLGDAPQFLPRRHGFDEYLGLPYSNDMWPFHPEFVNRPADVSGRKPGFPPLPLIDGDHVINTNVASADQNHLTRWYTERAVRFIEQNREKPFFLYLAHSMPHVPLHVSDSFRGRSERGLYGDVIAEIDWSVGQVLQALQRQGLSKRTWVIFTSDNGPWLNYGAHSGSAEPLREGKGTCWEGGTRVPCIMRWPGKIPAGTQSHDMLMTIDLFPTVARLVGAKLPAHKIDGLDVWPLISRRSGARNPHAGYSFYYENNQLQAVVTGDGRWKLVLPHTFRTLNGRFGRNDGTPIAYEHITLQQPELYDLRLDISERVNLAGQHPDIVKQLLAFAEDSRKDLGDTLLNVSGAGLREPGR